MRRFKSAAFQPLRRPGLMLHLARTRVGQWFVRGLFAILVLSFAFWGIQDVVRMQRARPVAQVGDIKVTQQAYFQEFQRAVQQLRSAFGPDFDTTKARQFGVDRQVLSQMVSRALFDAEVRELGITVPDANLAAVVRSNPSFQDQSGHFDRNRFDSVLRANELTEQSFTTMMRGDLERRQLVSAISGGITGPEPIARLLYAYRNEQRRVSAVSLPETAAGTLPQPSEAELQAYYKAHADAFARPEFRKISYFVVRPADIAAHMQIPDSDLRQAYQDRQASFVQPERRDFQQLLFRTRPQAEAAIVQLRSGAALDQLAKSANGVIASTEVKAARSDELLPAIGKTVFSTPAKQVGGPVESPLGWAVVRVSAVLAGGTRPFEEVRDSLRQNIASERAADKVYDIANQIEDERSGGASLAEVAKKLGVPVHTIDGIDHSGHGPDGSSVADLPDSPKFLDTVFEAQVSQDLDPLELQGGGYALARVDGIAPAKTPPFEEVRKRVLERQQADARQAALKKLADDVAKRARSDGNLAAAAKLAGQPVHDLGTIARDYKGEALSPDLVAELFKGAKGSIVSGSVGDGLLVAQVADIVKADAAAHPDGVKAVQSDIGAAMSEDVLRQYQAALETRFKAKVDVKAAEAVIGQPQD